MKKVLAGLVVVVVLVLGVAYFQLGALVKRGVESYGSRIVGAPVRVASVTISPFSGRGSVRGFTVGNPDGYPAGEAVSVEAIRVALDVRSLLSGPALTIRELRVEQPKISMLVGPGGTNLRALERNAQAYAPSGPGEAKKTQGRKVRIERFTLASARVSASLPAGRSYSLTLPDVELRGIGDKGGGATAAQAARQILSAVAASTARAAGGSRAVLDRVRSLLPAPRR